MDLIGECEALSEFYGDDKFYFLKENDGVVGYYFLTPSVSTSVLLLVNRSTAINTQLVLSKAPQSKSDDDSVLEYTVESLPPLLVEFSQKSISSKNISFSLHCDWISSENIEHVEDQLQLINEEKLNESSLASSLCFVEYEIIPFLFRCTDRPEFDGVMHFESFSEKNYLILELLLSYNEHKLREVAPDKVYECDVCSGCSFGKNFIRLFICGHLFCCQCVRSAFKTRLQAGVPEGCLQCLMCSKDVSEFDIRRILGKKLFSQYESCLLSKALSKMLDVVRCPRKTCESPVVPLSDCLAKCPQCDFSFCIKCRKTYHGKAYCSLDMVAPHFTKEEIIEIYEGNDVDKKQLLFKQLGKEQTRRLVEEWKTLDYLLSKTQRCPTCQVSVQRLTGCNRMICLACGVPFCWLCLCTKIDYDHFTAGKCENKLFIAHTIDEDHNEEYL